MFGNAIISCSLLCSPGQEDLQHGRHRVMLSETHPSHALPSITSFYLSFLISLLTSETQLCTNHLYCFTSFLHSLPDSPSFLSFPLSPSLPLKHYSGLNLVPVWSNIPHYTSHTSLRLSHHQCTFQCLIIFLSFSNVCDSLRSSFKLSRKDLWSKYKHVKLYQQLKFPPTYSPQYSRGAYPPIYS